MRTWIAALFVCLISTGVSAQSVTNGTNWVNKKGSELRVVDIASDGAFNGVYINKANDFHCGDDPMSVTGTLKDNLISFSVRWKNDKVDCNAVTVWIGYYVDGKLYLNWDEVYISESTGLPTHQRNSDIFEQRK